MTNAPASDRTTTAILDVTGMTCASCVRHVERALAGVAGVQSAAVNLVTRQARVAFAPAAVRREDLVAAVVGAGYGVQGPTAPGGAALPGRSASEQAERRTLVRDLVLAALATLPLLVLGMAHGAIPFAETAVGRAVQLVLATVVVFGPGRRFLRAGVAAVRRGRADMHTLVALGVLAAWGWSAAVTLWPAAFAAGAHASHVPHVFFEAAAAIVAFVLLGTFLESRARWRLGDAVRALHALVPAIAHRVDGPAADAAEQDVAAAALRPGDVVRVRPGERLPGDGVVVHGAAALDESLLTGESAPVDRAPGDRVVGGSLAHGGALLVRLDRTGDATVLARIAASVADAQGSRAPIARLADRVSAVFVPIVLVLAAATFGVWWLLEPSAAGVAVAVEHAVAVLVLACPCALGLATPAAIAVGAGRAAQLGVLFRTATALERASHVDTVVFDKTGTLTNGAPALVALEPAPGTAADTLLALAAAVELGSEHPFARAVVAAARARGVVLPTAHTFAALPAHGVSARIDGAVVRVGKLDWLRAEGVAVAPSEAAAASLAARGTSPLVVARGDAVLGVLGVADAVRDDARDAIASLGRLGVRVAMSSGDRRAVADAVARDVGITDVAADLLPTDKVARLAALRARGGRVAMVGDGVNDAPALAAADLGVALGHGTDVAAAAADVVVLRSGLHAVPAALELARATLRTIRRNLAWASVYNVLGLPIAAGVFAGAGLTLSPVLASALMSLSSVSVLVSSLWLRRFRPRTLPRP